MLRVSYCAVIVLCAALAACHFPGADELDREQQASEQELEAPSAFRLTSLALRDPHAFAGALFFCTDVTDTFSQQVGDAMSADAEPEDGILDLSIVGLFRPLDPTLPENPVELHRANCTVDDTECTDGENPPVEGVAVNLTEGTCFAPADGTTRPYDPPLATPDGPCFSTAPSDFSLEFGEISLTLRSAQLAGSYSSSSEEQGAPVDGIATGVVSGFLSEADADAINLPDDIPVVGGDPLSSLLRGGNGNCKSGDDRDTGPDGESGWWVYLNFEAELVPWTDAPPQDDDGETPEQQ